MGKKYNKKQSGGGPSQDPTSHPPKAQQPQTPYVPPPLSTALEMKESDVIYDASIRYDSQPIYIPHLNQTYFQDQAQHNTPAASSHPSPTHSTPSLVLPHSKNHQTTLVQPTPAITHFHSSTTLFSPQPSPDPNDISLDAIYPTPIISRLTSPLQHENSSAFPSSPEHSPPPSPCAAVDGNDPPATIPSCTAIDLEEKSQKIALPPITAVLSDLLDSITLQTTHTGPYDRREGHRFVETLPTVNIEVPITQFPFKMNSAHFFPLYIVFFAFFLIYAAINTVTALSSTIYRKKGLMGSAMQYAVVLSTNFFSPIVADRLNPLITSGILTVVSFSAHIACNLHVSSVVAGGVLSGLSSMASFCNQLFRLSFCSHMADEAFLTFLRAKKCYGAPSCQIYPPSPLDLGSDFEPSFATHQDIEDFIESVTDPNGRIIRSELIRANEYYFKRYKYTTDTIIAFSTSFFTFCTYLGGLLGYGASFLLLHLLKKPGEVLDSNSSVIRTLFICLLCVSLMGNLLFFIAYALIPKTVFVTIGVKSVAQLRDEYQKLEKELSHIHETQNDQQNTIDLTKINTSQNIIKSQTDPPSIRPPLPKSIIPPEQKIPIMTYLKLTALTTHALLQTNAIRLSIFTFFSAYAPMGFITGTFAAKGGVSTALGTEYLLLWSAIISASSCLCGVVLSKFILINTPQRARMCLFVGVSINSLTLLLVLFVPSHYWRTKAAAWVVCAIIAIFASLGNTLSGTAITSYLSFLAYTPNLRAPALALSTVIRSFGLLTTFLLAVYTSLKVQLYTLLVWFVISISLQAINLITQWGIDVDAIQERLDKYQAELEDEYIAEDRAVVFDEDFESTGDSEYNNVIARSSSNVQDRDSGISVELQLLPHVPAILPPVHPSQMDSKATLENLARQQRRGSHASGSRMRRRQSDLAMYEDQKYNSNDHDIIDEDIEIDIDAIIEKATQDANRINMVSSENVEDDLTLSQQQQQQQQQRQDTLLDTKLRDHEDLEKIKKAHRMSLGGDYYEYYGVTKDTLDMIRQDSESLSPELLLAPAPSLLERSHSLLHPFSRHSSANLTAGVPSVLSGEDINIQRHDNMLQRKREKEEKEEEEANKELQRFFPKFQRYKRRGSLPLSMYATSLASVNTATGTIKTIRDVPPPNTTVVPAALFAFNIGSNPMMDTISLRDAMDAHVLQHHERVMNKLTHSKELFKNRHSHMIGPQRYDDYRAYIHTTDGTQSFKDDDDDDDDDNNIHNVNLPPHHLNSQHVDDLFDDGVHLRIKR